MPALAAAEEVTSAAAPVLEASVVVRGKGGGLSGVVVYFSPQPRLSPLAERKKRTDQGLLVRLCPRTDEDARPGDEEVGQDAGGLMQEKERMGRRVLVKSEREERDERAGAGERARCLFGTAALLSLSFLLQQCDLDMALSHHGVRGKSRTGLRETGARRSAGGAAAASKCFDFFAGSATLPLPRERCKQLREMHRRSLSGAAGTT
jgi:hypothetical protein